MTTKELFCRCLGFVAEVICRDQRNDSEMYLFFREQCESQKYYSPSCRNICIFFFLFFLKNIWNLSLDIMYIVLWLHLQSQEVFIVIAIVVMLRAESVIWTYWRWLYWQKFIVILIVLYNKWFHDIPSFLWLCFPGALKYHLFVDITTTTKKMSQWNLNKQTNKNPSKTLCQRETLRWCWIPSLNFK